MAIVFLYICQQNYPRMLVFESEITYTVQNHSENMTDEEFYDFCAANRDLRIERDKDRNIIIMAPVFGESGYFEKQAISSVDAYEQAYKGVSFSSSTGFKLPNGATRSPDACWVSPERWATLSATDKKQFLPVTPDFVIEIRSATDSLKKLQDKMQEWIEAGVRLGWLIDSQNQNTHIYREHRPVEIVESFDLVLSGEDVMPGFEFDLGRLRMP